MEKSPSRRAKLLN